MASGFGKAACLMASLFITLGASSVEARKLERRPFDPQVEFETLDSSGATSTYDCYQKTSKFGGLFASDDQKKHRRMALDAANEAIGQGYNWAVLGPLEFVSDSYSSSSTQWERVGGSLGIDPFGFFTPNVYAPVTRTTRSSRARYFLSCLAVDDLDAYLIMWNDHPAYHPRAGDQLVDLRSLVTVLGPELDGSDHRVPPPARQNISDIHYRKPGDRERIMDQLAAMQGAANCRRTNRTLDPDSLKFAAPDASQRAAENTCLEALRPLATASGWTRFPLFVADDKATVVDRGFQRFGSPAETPVALAGSRTTLDPDIWGSKATLPGVQLDGAGLSDVFAVLGEGRSPRGVIVASNTVPRERLLDVAVFLIASTRLTQFENGIGFKEDIQVRSQFEAHAKRLGRKPSGQQERLSQDVASSGMNKAMYRALEDFKTVIYLDSYEAYEHTFCKGQYIVCADKLTAYNTLGPRVVGSTFKPLSIPARYSPYIPK